MKRRLGSNSPKTEVKKLNSFPRHLESVKLLVPLIEFLEGSLYLIGGYLSRRYLHFNLVELPDITYVRRPVEEDLVRTDIHRPEAFKGLLLHFQEEPVDSIQIDVISPGKVRASEIATDVHGEHPEGRVGSSYGGD